MKKCYLIKNPELFQGKKFLNKNKQYFEGWYFKHTTNKYSISFIPGISINEDERKAFIQIITNKNSYYIDYDIKDFEYNDYPFYIKIHNNYFSKNKIHIDINDNTQNLKIIGNIKYTNNKNINTSFFNPNIMGPFSYLPFMECNHAVLCMQNNINGNLKINDKNIKFDNGIGYIEKDWGYSFPKSYIWCQCNNFKKSKASFMLSIANIPFKIFTFKGIICSLIINNKEYRFATYNNTKLVKYNITNNKLDITLKKGKYYLNINSKIADSLKLKAPVKGKMTKNILESISASVQVTLRKKKTIIFSDISSNCGLEIVNE